MNANDVTLLPAYAMRSVTVPMPDDMIDALDKLCRADENGPSRAALIREAVTMYLEVHAMPAQITLAIADMIETARMIASGGDETPAGCTGETTGKAQSQGIPEGLRLA